MSDYPPEFNDVIRQLEAVVASGSAISGRVIQLKTTLMSALDNLRRISEQTASISELISRLKASLAELERKNDELERTLSEGRADFDSQMAELQERQRRELDQERRSLATEKEELERSFAQRAEMSQEERESAIREAKEAADARARQQTEEIQRAHEEERAKLVAQYQKEYNGLLKALSDIARNQGNAIDQISDELGQSEQLTTEFASVQQQILGLLASISAILNDTSVQRSSPLMGESQGLERLEAALPLPPGQIPPEYFAPNINLSDTRNLDELKNSPDNSKKFEYMLKILKLRENRLSDAEGERYNWMVKGPFGAWQRDSANPNITAQELLTRKENVYKNVTKLFNETTSIPPETEQMQLQVGGRRTRRHRRRVHFKTRVKKGGKSGKKGCKKGGKKGGRKSHKGGKRTGGKRTRKH